MSEIDEYFPWNCPEIGAEFSIGSGYGLVPSKPLPEPMLTQIYVPILPAVGPNGLTLRSKQNDRHFPDDSSNQFPHITKFVDFD